jgi:hypothetical protein
MILLAYLIAGTVIARQVYAKQYLALNSAGKKNKIRELKSSINSMKHGASCYKNPDSSYYSLTRGCDCNLSGAWRTKVDDLNDLKNEDKPTNPYLVLVSWPIFGYHKLLVGGVPNQRENYDPELTARLEHELQIGN